MKLGIVTPFFDWVGSARKRENFVRFLNQEAFVGVPILIVECALFGEPFYLEPSDKVIRVRCRSILWQKEALFNIALRQLPHDWDAVAWVDGDILFTDPHWWQKASNALRSSAVLQLFETFSYLPSERTIDLPGDPVRRSFMGGLVNHTDPETPAILGHPGFAWAARMDVLREIGGLYEQSAIGGADRLMAHAWFGDYYAKSVGSVARGAIFEDYLRWARRTYSVIRGSVGVVPGKVLHLWHGNLIDRQYSQRHISLEEFGFDPAIDLTKNSYGCLEWGSDKPEMHAWVAEYFPSRRENS
jgi:hypothetical protein